MDHHVRIHLTTAALVIALGFTVSLVTSTWVAARAYRQRGAQAEQRDRTITVKGSTRQRIRSDQAVWNIRVRGDGETLQQAFAGLDAATQRVREFLRGRDFGDAEVGLGAIETTTHRRRDEKGNELTEIVGQTLERSFYISTREVERVESSAGSVTELLQEGLYVVSEPPRYYYSALAQLRVDLMAAASADARDRAQRIAASTGASLGPLRDAHMGVLQVTRPHSTDVSDYGLYDTGTIDKDVQAVVTATFALGGL